MVRIKAGVSANTRYVAGQQHSSLAHDTAPARLAANENPYGPLPGVLRAMSGVLDQVNRYPHPSGAPLCAAIAGHYSIPPDHVTIGPGAGALCERAVASTSGPRDEIVYPWPSFPGYDNHVALSGATPVRVPLTADHAHDPRAMAAAVTDRTRALIVCSPNNPTGTVVGHDELTGLLRELPRHLLVILDEAYIEFADPARTARGLELIHEFENMLIVRTFSKAFGLAGLRVGYAIAGRPPWPSSPRRRARSR